MIFGQKVGPESITPTRFCDRAKVNALLGRASEIGADDVDALLDEEPIKAV
jgi:hypothetical protein